MVGNGGWLRVVEASISVLLVVGVLLSIPYSYDSLEDNRLEKQLQFAVNNIAENMSLRVDVLNYSLTENPDSVNNLQIVQRINKSLYGALTGSKPEINFKICLLNETCSLTSPGGKESYSIERIITTSISNSYFLPRKIRVVAFEVQ